MDTTLHSLLRVYSIHDFLQRLGAGWVLRKGEGGGQIASVGQPENEGEHQPGGHQQPAGGGVGEAAREVLAQQHPRHVLEHRCDA